MNRLRIVLLLLLAPWDIIFAQDINFAIPDTVCLEEELVISNSSTNADSYLWDFCNDALGTTYHDDSRVHTVTGASQPQDLEIVYSLGSWYGFVTSRSSNELIRLDFSDSLFNDPIETNLGNIDGLFSSPVPIQLIEISGNWYGFLVNSGDGKLLRLDFGSDLTSVPTVEDLGNPEGWVDSRGSDLVYDGSSYMLLVTGAGSDQVSVVDFGSSPANAIQSSVSISNPGTVIDVPVGISVIEWSGDWYGLVGTSTNQLFHLSFGSSLLNDPTITSLGASTQPRDLFLVEDGGSYYGLVGGQSNLYRISFGDELTVDGDEQIEDLGNLGGLLNNVFGGSLVRDGTGWKMGLLNQSNNELIGLAFSDSCSYVSALSSSDYEPDNISYTESGQYSVRLTGTSSNGSQSFLESTVVVGSSTSSDISITKGSNECISSTTSFTANDLTGDIVSYSWDFGDGTGVSSASDTVYQYSSSGSYTISLTGTNADGCLSRASESIEIYPEPPVPSFDLSYSDLCTSTEISLDNTTNEGASSGQISYEWDISGDLSTATDTVYSFLTSGSQTISLRSWISGCGFSTSVDETIEIVEGPVVAFDYTNNCYGDTIVFSSDVSGDITGYSWDLGDGIGTSSSADTTYRYSSASGYTVSLSVGSSNGCVTTYERTLTVNDQPLLSFSPTEGIENIGVSFVGEDLTLSDDSVTSWSWDFASLGSSALESPEFTFNTPGDYDVDLRVMTAQGCADTLVNNVTIAEAESATLSYTLPDTVCIGEDLVISNSSVNAENYLWDFCNDALSTTYHDATNVYTVSGASQPQDLEIVYSLGSWYGFVTSRSSNELIRLDFSDSLFNDPIETNLGNIDGLFSSPVPIQLIEISGNWYGFLVNSGDGKLLRLDFGSDLTSVPTVEDLGNPEGWVDSRGSDLVYDGSSYMLLVTGAGSDQVSVVDFGSSPANAIQSSVSISNPGTVIDVPVGISVIEWSGDWYGLVGTSTNQLFHLSFGSSLLNDPTITSLGASTQPRDLFLVEDGGSYYGLVGGQSNLYRISFGDELTVDGDEQIEDLGNLGGLLNNVFGGSLVRDGTGWKMGLLNQSNNELIGLAFSDSCSYVSALSSSDYEPDNISYTESGQNSVRLTGTSSNGSQSFLESTVVVRSSTSSDISITKGGNECISSTTSFTANDLTGDIVSYSWDFGDGTGVSSASDTVYQYSSSGSYTISLTGTNADGCLSRASESIEIYPEPPVPSFDLSYSDLCTSTEISLDNTTNEGASSGQISYEWDISGDLSTATDTVYSFLTSGSQTISLRSWISGCGFSTSVDETIEIVEGPVVAFDYTNNCYGDTIVFSSDVSGDITGYSWDLGDGIGTSSSADTTYRYSSASGYTVSLSVGSSNGCVTTYERTLTVNDQPLLSFSPTEGIENIGVSFVGEDLTLSDDSVTSWSWDFASLGSSALESPEFTFNTPGDYDVDLRVMTAQGCADTLVNNVTIAEAESATLSYTLPDTVCIGEDLVISNSSVNAENYLWDFCNDALSTTYHDATNVYTVSGASQPQDLEIVYSLGSWYGFVTSRSSNELIRLDFSDSLFNDPLETNLGDIGDLLDQPSTLELVEISGNWYGYLVNSGDGKLLRLDFGSDLTSVPAVEDLGNPEGWVDSRGLDLVYDGSSYMLLVTGAGSDQVSVVDFGSSPANAIQSSVSISNPGTVIDVPVGISVIEWSGDWYGLVGTSTNQLFHLSFGSSLLNDPTITELGASNQPKDLFLVEDGGSYYGLVGGQSNLYRISFGDELTVDGDEQIEDLGNLGGLLNNVFGGSLVRDGTGWKMGLLNQSNNELIGLAFSDSCSYVSALSSSDYEPDNISYTESGQNSVRLTGTSSNGSQSFLESTVVVRSSTSSDISITKGSNECISSTTSFTANDLTGDIVSYSWDFGDGTGVSSASDTVYQYSSSGSYTISLTGTNADGCLSRASESIEIYPEPPVPSFDLSYSDLCTSTEISLDNTTNEGASSGQISYEWDISGDLSTATDTVYSFLTSGSQTISLRSWISGCGFSTSVDETIEIVEGPVVAFDYTNNCYGDTIVFSSDVSGDITGYSWDLGDGIGTSSSADTTYRYSSASGYTVSLSVGSSNGCVTTYERTLTVNDQPLLSFSPTEGIENIGVSFVGEDLTLSDDSVTSWSWDFASLGSSALESPEFTFNTPGDYDVDLRVMTAQGCADTLVNNVTIAEAESATLSYTLPDTVCIGEDLVISNSSVNAENYLWDFCNDALSTTYHDATNVYTVSGASQPQDLEIVYSLGSWYGFVTSRSSNELIRLDFSDSLFNDPLETNLGDIGDLLDQPSTLELVEISGNWYGYLVNSGDGKLLRLDFGSDLTSVPAVEDLGNPEGWVDSRGLDLVYDGSSYMLLVTGAGSDQVSVVDFGSSPANAIQSSVSISNPGTVIDVPVGISVIEWSGDWYGLVGTSTNQLFHLSFGSSLLNDPTITELGASNQPKDLFLVEDGGSYYGLVGGQSNLYRISFGDELTVDGDEQIEDLGNLGGLLNNVFGGSLVRDGTGWKMGLLNQSNNELIGLAFSDSCSYVSALSSSDYEPDNISYTESGQNSVRLTGTSSNGSQSFLESTVVVRSSTSSDISITKGSNECISSTTSFTANDLTGDIVSYSWGFGDGTGVSSASDTVYQYSSSGSYTISLTGTNADGCLSRASESIEIYPEPPVPSFDYSNNILCTLTEIEIINSTDDSQYGTALQYIWQLDGEIVGSDRDITFESLASGQRIITLVTEIPGCTSDPTYDTVNISPTPEIDFDYTVVCEGLPTQFGNVSVSQNIESFTWDFGDGYFNTNENPEHLYEGNGQYSVTMAVVDEEGCVNQIQKIVVVDQIPTPTFSVEGNIACSESEVQFLDETDNTVANVTEWIWDFGDGNTDDVMNPTHHYSESGEYNVSLTVFNDASCEATFDSLIVVDQTPLVDFEVDIGCINEETSFSDLSSGNITSWFWNIGEEVSTEQNPIIVFETPGVYDISLEITTSDFCVISTNKQIAVNDLPTVDFEIQNNCLNELITFNDNSEEFGDPIISRRWNFGDGFSADGSTVYHEYLVSGTYQVTLEAITRNGCVLETSEILEISPAPTASFSVDNTFGAPPLSIAISNESIGAMQYAWLLNDDTISTEENTLLTLTEVGQPELKLMTTNEYGCIDSVSQEFIIANPQYDLNLIDFEIVQNDESFSLVLDLINSSNLPVSNFDVNVEFDNEFTLTESFEGQIDIGERIVYQLEVEIPSNQDISYICTALESPHSEFEDVNPGNNEKCVDFTSEINVEPPSPNPTSTTTTIKVVLPDRMDITLVVTDMSGNIIDEINYNNLSKGLQNIEVDLTTLNKGMYLLQIIHDNGKEVQRIQKR